MTPPLRPHWWDLLIACCEAFDRSPRGVVLLGEQAITDAVQAGPLGAAQVLRAFGSKRLHDDARMLAGYRAAEIDGTADGRFVLWDCHVTAAQLFHTLARNATALVDNAEAIPSPPADSSDDEASGR